MPQTVKTALGLFHGVTWTEQDAGGHVRALRLSEKNPLQTCAGELIPHYCDESPRRKYKPSVTFYANGALHAVSLEQRQPVLTPVGEIDAELVTFDRDGALLRVFPLDGQLSGFWSEEDEKALNTLVALSFPFGSFKPLLNSLCFYSDGGVHSVSVYPGDRVSVRLPSGAQAEVQGFSLYPDGRLQTVEPAQPFAVKTPVGVLHPFDPGALTVSADNGSFRLDKQGRPVCLTTVSDRVLVGKDDRRCFSPAFVPNPLDDEAPALLPLKIEFDYDAGLVSFSGAQEGVASLKENCFQTAPFSGQAGCSGGCASCPHSCG